MLGVELIEDEARLARLGCDRRALLAVSAADRPFLTWEWLSAWWRHLRANRRLSILALREGGDLVGSRHLRCVRRSCADCCHFGLWKFSAPAASARIIST
ncbi:MAG: hypothetical protein ACYCT1_19695 [Steroidobacteraceae bacterium]|jgi:hypothetical protein